ncbi:MAG TPA: hypothetical protein VGH88_05835 [Streptosporangiaceae bacterium]|jgi:hypothetical protein
MPSSPPADDRYAALGQVVEMAAIMEISLRMAFGALVGGPYAAVVASRQETHWLIENCEAVARRHAELPQARRDAILHALRACRQANHDRNRLVHDAWGTGPGGGAVVVRSARRSYEIAGPAWDAGQIAVVAAAITAAQAALLTAIEDALGADRLLPAQSRY